MTMVAGRVVAEHGKVLTVDEAAIKAEIRERTPALQRELAATAAAAEKLEPYYRRDVPARRRDRCRLQPLAQALNS